MARRRTRPGPDRPDPRAPQLRLDHVRYQKTPHGHLRRFLQRMARRHVGARRFADRGSIVLDRTHRAVPRPYLRNDPDYRVGQRLPRRPPQVEAALQSGQQVGRGRPKFSHPHQQHRTRGANPGLPQVRAENRRCLHQRRRRPSLRDQDPVQLLRRHDVRKELCIGSRHPGTPELGRGHHLHHQCTRRGREQPHFRPRRVEGQNNRQGHQGGNPVQYP